MKLAKWPLILSSIATIVCASWAIYERFVVKGDAFIWTILALCNLTIFFSNLSIYESAKKKQNKEEQNKEETPAEITEENKEETKED